MNEVLNVKSELKTLISMCLLFLCMVERQTFIGEKRRRYRGGKKQSLFSQTELNNLKMSNCKQSGSKLNFPPAVVFVLSCR